MRDVDDFGELELRDRLHMVRKSRWWWLVGKGGAYTVEKAESFMYIIVSSNQLAWKPNCYR